MMHICRFEGAIAIGKPKDWDESLEGPCGTIYVSTYIDTLTGLPVMASVYKPTDEEIEALQQGGLIRLAIVGRQQHPVFQLGVMGPCLAADVDAEPMSSLGDVIRKPK